MPLSGDTTHTYISCTYIVHSLGGIVRSRRVGSAGAIAAFVVTAGLIMPASASAAVSGSLSCYQNGKSTFACDLTLGGGYPPYTTTWTTAGGYSSLDYTDTYHVEGSCGSKIFAFHVTANVTDAAGSTFSKTADLQCVYGWTPGS